MPHERPEVTLHLATSLDGYIAHRDHTVSWLESPDDAYPAGASVQPINEVVVPPTPK